MEQIELRTLFRFYDEEVNKYLKEDRFVPDKDQALKTVSQAIYWGVMLFDFCRKSNNQRFDNHIMDCKLSGLKKGIIYARNRVTHQFPHLLKITDGAILSAPLPSPFFEIAWKNIDELPDPDPKYDSQSQRDRYTENLAGIPVRFAFDQLNDLFLKILEDENF
ncbi:MAG: hypothetical protein HWE23_00920 [Rhodobacteraceae bacterium]|nr:hypothetical protein [Paracoccaceae bacterium]